MRSTAFTDATAPPQDVPVALWRHHSAAAVRALLDDLESPAERGSPV